MIKTYYIVVGIIILGISFFPLRDYFFPNPKFPSLPTIYPSYQSTAKVTLASLKKASPCKWYVAMSLEGFAPNSPIMANSKFRQSKNCDPTKMENHEWTADIHKTTTSDGKASVAYEQDGFGSYTYTFTDDKGNKAEVSFSYDLTPTPSTQ